MEQGSKSWLPLVLIATSTYLSDKSTCWPLLMHRRLRGVLCAFVSMSRRQHSHVPSLCHPHSLLYLCSLWCRIIPDFSRWHDLFGHWTGLERGLMAVFSVPHQGPCTCPRRADIDTPLFQGTELYGVRLTGPYFYLPKMESHLEARLWNDIFCEAQDMLNIPRGTIKVGSCATLAMLLGLF